jgi:hypothetical protein
MYRKRKAFEPLTAADERAGLFRNMSSIGTADGWVRELDAVGLSIEGHELVFKYSLN